MNVCMLAYAHYINDARIKNYVQTLDDHGHTVDVIALRSEGESELEKRQTGTIFRIMPKYQGDSTFRYMWSYLAFFVRASFLLTRRSVSSRYDVIHVHNMPNALVFAAIVPWLCGARVILDVHDLMTVNYMAKFDAGHNAVPIKVLKLEQMVSSWFAHRLFCADHNQRDYLVKTCRIPEHKISVLLNLPSVGLFRPITPQRKPEVFRIVYHGTIAHRLGIDLIVRAMARVAQQVPAELWVYGAGDCLIEVKRLASELGLHKVVHFSGSFFPVEEIPNIVCGMDLGIIGNRRNLACDQFMLPVKLLEYVYLGVPVVAPRLEVIRYYFDESMIRFYEPENIGEMADAIVSLYQNRAERERQAQAARAFYQKHSPQAQAQLYLDLLTEDEHRSCALRKYQA